MDPSLSEAPKFERAPSFSPVKEFISSHWSLKEELHTTLTIKPWTLTKALKGTQHFAPKTGVYWVLEGKDSAFTMDGFDRFFMETTVAKLIYLDEEGSLIEALSRSCGFRQIGIEGWIIMMKDTMTKFNPKS